MNQPVRRNAEVMAGWTQALAHNGLRLQSKGPEEKLTVGETTLVITIRPLLQEEEDQY